MTEPPGAAVIIPCYNQAHFLSDAIASALAQTYPSLQVVVVDDGSTDDTSAVAAGYSGVTVVRQENFGLSAARNAGLAASTGPFCLFLDADDVLPAEAIEVGIDHLILDEQLAFTSGLCTLIAPDGSYLFTPEQLVVDSDHYRVLLRNNYIWNPGSVMYRRQMLEQEGGFDLSVSAAADYDLYLRLARHFPVACHDTVVVRYRIHGRNMSSDADHMLKTITHVLHAQEEYVRGDPSAEADLAAGIRGRELFYTDELLRSIRSQWNRRLPDIEQRLAHPLEPGEHEVLIDEIRLLYRWLIQAFSLKKRNLDERDVRLHLQTRLKLLKKSQTDAELQRDELGRELTDAVVARDDALEHMAELRRLIKEHAGEVRGFAAELETQPLGADAPTLLAKMVEELEYRALVTGVRMAASRAVPKNATILVVSHGDDELLKLVGLDGQHFPQAEGNVHAGHHPADLSEALANVDLCRAKGAGFLLIPRNAQWWFTVYSGFDRGLEARGTAIWEDDSCVIYRLT